MPVARRRHGAIDEQVDRKDRVMNVTVNRVHHVPRRTDLRLCSHEISRMD